MVTWGICKRVTAAFVNYNFKLSQDLGFKLTAPWTEYPENRELISSEMLWSGNTDFIPHEGPPLPSREGILHASLSLLLSFFFISNQELRRLDTYSACRIWCQMGWICKYLDYWIVYSISVSQSFLPHMKDNIHWVRVWLSQPQSLISQDIGWNLSGATFCVWVTLKFSFSRNFI